MTYFSIKELCHSDTAERLGISNTPSESERANLVALIDNVLDPAREEYSAPIKVTSGYRCSKLNARVGGETHSQHKAGQAADIVSVREGARGNYIIGKIIAFRGVFDQLIFEDVAKTGKMMPGWIHVSYRSDGKNRKQILKKVKGSKAYTQITLKDLI